MPKLSAAGRQIDFEQRFDSLFETHYVAVYRYCLRRLGRSDGEDAAADVFAIAWRRLDQVPAAEATRAWLLGVAYRVVGNHYRSRRRRAQLSDRLLTERQVPDDPESSGDVEIELLHRALESLRKGDRELLRMSSWDGLSNGEIAAVIGIKENAIDQRLFRARSRLRNRLDHLKKESPRINARKAST